MSTNIFPLTDGVISDNIVSIEKGSDGANQRSLFENSIAIAHAESPQVHCGPIAKRKARRIIETKRNVRYLGLFDAEAAINLQDRTVRTIVGLFENYDLSLTAFDVKGEAFEYFLSDTFTGGLGEYFTPRNIVEFIVDAIDPKIGDWIVDPFCGTGGFLIYAFEVVGEKIRLQEFSDEEKARWRLELSDRSLSGTDWKDRTSQACKMNMMVHGDGSAGIFMHHGLVDVPDRIEESRFAICLTNPPFGSVENDPEILKNYELGAGRKSQSRVVLALERAVRLIKPGGWIGIVVIDGILNNRSLKHVRDYLKRTVWIRGIVSLAPETFEGYGARAKTSVLFLQKKDAPDEGEQLPVFMAIAQNTGYAPNGAQIPGNELPEILIDYKDFRRGTTSEKRHANSWTAIVKDRLDAEFYWSRDSIEGKDISILRHDVTKLLEDINAEYAALTTALDRTLAEQELRTTKLGTVFEETSIRETLNATQSYRLLGVRWWGEGSFVREEKRGSEIKAKSLYRVSAGWLVYNRLFAFRGSFAIVTEEQDGCYASGEFPTFAVRPEIELPDLTARYIVYCLNSPQYLNMVDRLSTGSTKTSRNRFNQTQFLDIAVQMPASEQGLRHLVGLLDKVGALRVRQQELQEQIKALSNGIAMMLPLPDQE